MINVNVLYPNSEGSTFDKDYYLTKHTPTLQERLKGSLRGLTVDFGIAGGMPGAPAAFVCICNLTFDSVEAFQAEMAANGAEIMADIPNYTNVSPVIQISDVKL